MFVPVTRLRVLVVDDDPHVGEFLREFLSREGCKVETMSDPRAAIERLRAKDPFDILILDLLMPQMHGIEVLDHIRRVNREISIIIYTGFPSLESAQSAIGMDIAAYLKKPCSTAELRDTISRVARRKGIAVRPEDEFHVALGRRIRSHRQQQSLTLRVLGERTGMSISQLSQVERAESSASISSLFKIARALGTRVSELVDLDGF